MTLTPGLWSILKKLIAAIGQIVIGRQNQNPDPSPSSPNKPTAHEFLRSVDEWYARARSSYWFLVVFLGAVACAFLAHYSFHWDKDWGNTNLYLSIDASVSAVMIIIHNARAERYQRHLLEAMHILLEEIAKKDR